MVEYVASPLDAVFHALADPTRRSIVARLAAGSRTVGELSRPFAISLAAVSKHLKVLERAGLVRREVRGREHTLSLDPAKLSEAAAWLHYHERFWRESLDGLEAFLAQHPDSGRPQSAPIRPVVPPSPPKTKGKKK